MKLPKITNTTIITKCDQKVITKCDIYYNMMQLLWSATTHPAGCYIFKTSNRNTRTSCEICLKLTIKTPELRQWHHSGRHHNDVIGVVLVSLLLTLNIFHSLFVHFSHIIKMLCDFKGGSLSRQLSTLTSLVSMGLLLVEI